MSEIQTYSVLCFLSSIKRDRVPKHPAAFC